MVEPGVTALSALHGLIAAGRHGRATGAAGVRIREVTGFAALTIIAHKGRAADIAAILSRQVGSTVVDAPKRATGNGLAITGTAPGQWLAISRTPNAAQSIESLRGTLDGLAAVSDQGDGRLVLDISGPNARDTLAKGVPIDLDPVAFKIGDAAQTSASLIGLQIALIDNAPMFEIVSARSTAASLRSWLFSSAAEYGIEIA